jgi:hypothetical protein
MKLESKVVEVFVMKSISFSTYLYSASLVCQLLSLQTVPMLRMWLQHGIESECQNVDIANLTPLVRLGSSGTM